MVVKHLVKRSASFFSKQSFQGSSTKYGRCFKLGMENTKDSGTMAQVASWYSGYHLLHNFIWLSLNSLMRFPRFDVFTIFFHYFSLNFFVFFICVKQKYPLLFSLSTDCNCAVVNWMISRLCWFQEVGDCMLLTLHWFMLYNYLGFAHFIHF